MEQCGAAFVIPVWKRANQLKSRIAQVNNFFLLSQVIFIAFLPSTANHNLHLTMSSLGQSLPFAVICWLLVICLLPTPGQSQCRPTDNTCEFWLHLDHKMTMMYGREAVYAQGGQLYKYNDATASTPLDPTDIITADGWEGPRYVVAVNGSMPGPKIEVSLLFPLNYYYGWCCYRHMAKK